MLILVPLVIFWTVYAFVRLGRARHAGSGSVPTGTASTDLPSPRVTDDVGDLLWNDLDDQQLTRLLRSAAPGPPNEQEPA